jgi:hypothetical protein
MADVILAIRRRDLAPTLPHLEHFFGIAARAQDAAHLVEVETGVLSLRVLAAPLALAVSPFHASEDPRQLLALCRVGRRRDRLRQFQEAHLAR